MQGYATSHAPCKRVRDNYKSSCLGRLPGALWRVRWIHAQSLESDSAMTIPTHSESVAWKTGEFFRRDLPGWLRGWDTSNSPGALSRGGRFRNSKDGGGEEEEEEEGSGEDSDGEFSCYSSRGSGSSVEEPKKPKRTRTAYSNYQLDQLELVFTQTRPVTLSCCRAPPRGSDNFDLLMTSLLCCGRAWACRVVPYYFACC